MPLVVLLLLFLQLFLPLVQIFMASLLESAALAAAADASKKYGTGMLAGVVGVALLKRTLRLVPNILGGGLLRSCLGKRKIPRPCDHIA